MSSDIQPQVAAFQSSGDLIADRRAEYARDYARGGDYAAAADLMAQALELAPGHVPFLVKLGEWLTRLGRTSAAREALTQALTLDPADRHGAALKLALLGETDVPDQPPAAYVEGLFDAYASRFDSALIEKLAYRGPDLIWQALLEVAGENQPAYAHVLDLGCGTGLTGERVRKAAAFLEGVDLSAGMLREAQGKGVYDRLVHGDAFAPAEPGATPADLVLAGDVLCYLGNLETAFRVVASRMAPGGLFAFTVEAGGEDDDFTLRQSMRYAHGRRYLERELEAAGLTIRHWSGAQLRRDRGSGIAGYVVVAERVRQKPAIAPVASLADGALPEAGKLH